MTAFFLDRCRTHGGVRILYYHRVNDDNDPFFNAISTTLFEQEMRYISRHYKVLSLGDALKHLESDSTEAVLAITFDDGYQDNYVNAFPILPVAVWTASHHLFNNRKHGFG